MCAKLYSTLRLALSPTSRVRLPDSTATRMADDARDPLPLIHLANLDFDCSPKATPDLPSYQLALAPLSIDCKWARRSWIHPRVADSPRWPTKDESSEPTLKRTFRRRRERARAQIAARAPMGIFSSSEDRKKDQFPHFETIYLNFALDNLEALTSAQLAVSSLPL